MGINEFWLKISPQKFKSKALIHSDLKALLSNEIFLYIERIPQQFPKISQRNLKEILKKCY
jgi:hypothetical protein